MSIDGNSWWILKNLILNHTLGYDNTTAPGFATISDLQWSAQNRINETFIEGFSCFEASKELVCGYIEKHGFQNLTHFCNETGFFKVCYIQMPLFNDSVVNLENGLVLAGGATILALSAYGAYKIAQAVNNFFIPAPVIAPFAAVAIPPMIPQGKASL